MAETAECWGIAVSSKYPNTEEKYYRSNWFVQLVSNQDTSIVFDSHTYFLCFLLVRHWLNKLDWTYSSTPYPKRRPRPGQTPCASEYDTQVKLVKHKQPWWVMLGLIDLGLFCVMSGSHLFVYGLHAWANRLLHAGDSDGLYTNHARSLGVPCNSERGCTLDAVWQRGGKNGGICRGDLVTKSFRRLHISVTINLSKNSLYVCHWLSCR